MTTLQAKTEYTKMATIFNKNLKYIKTQFSSETIESMKKKYNATTDSHLAKILMLRGVELF